MAIFNMEDSSLNEYLNENRSDRQIRNTLSAPNTDLSKRVADKVMDTRKKIVNKLRDGIQNYSNEELQQIRKQSLEGADKSLKSTDGMTYLSAGKDRKKMYGQTVGRELRKRGCEPKTGEKLNKQADPKTSEKLKEAAEYILAVLDESEKKNESLKDIKNRTFSSIKDRHEKANKEINKNLATINKNDKEINKSHKQNQKDLDDIFSRLNDL